MPKRRCHLRRTRGLGTVARVPGVTCKQSRFFHSTDTQTDKLNLTFTVGVPTHPFSLDDRCMLLADVGESVTEWGPSSLLHASSGL